MLRKNSANLQLIILYLYAAQCNTIGFSFFILMATLSSDKITVLQPAPF